MNKFLLFCALSFITPHIVYAADNHLLSQIVICESRDKLDAWGDNHLAYGPAQFHKVAFEDLKKKAHMEQLKWKNSHDQIVLLNWAIDNDYGYMWSCYRRIKHHKKIGD